MKAPYFCLAFLFVAFNCTDNNNINPNASSSGGIDFVKTFGGSGNDSAQSVVSTNDGGYTMLGFTQSVDGDITNKQDVSYDYWVVKFNAQNNIEWQNVYGGTNDDRGRQIIQTQEGGYAIIGSSASRNGDVSVNNGAQDFWLAKLDVLGNISWQKSLGFSGSDIGISVLQTNDQGYLLAGILDVTASGGLGNTNRTDSRLHAGGDYWVIKLDTLGNLEWSRYFGGNFTDIPGGIVQTDDNGFIIAGGSDSQDTDISGNIGSYDFWVIRIAANGDLVWEKSFGGQEIDEARAVIASDDGNFIIAGDTRSSTDDVSSNNGAADLWLIKISPDGNLIWEKTIGGSNFDVARALTKTRDNGFLIAGSSRSSDGDVSKNKGQNDAWALKVDSNGGIEWEIAVGGSNIDFAYGIAELNDKSVIVVGDTTSDDGDITENKGFTDALIVKIK
jgi:hypothetical protein